MIGPNFEYKYRSDRGKYDVVDPRLKLRPATCHTEGARASGAVYCPSARLSLCVSPRRLSEYHESALADKVPPTRPEPSLQRTGAGPGSG